MFNKSKSSLALHAALILSSFAGTAKDKLPDRELSGILSIEASANYLVPVSGRNVITVSSGTVTDNGGTGNYSNNCNGILTINPGTAGKKLRLDFTSLDVEQIYDYVQIYDGSDVSAPLIGQFYTNPGTVAATNAAGSITIRFVSNVVNTRAGFSADIKLVSQSPQADLVISAPAVNPNGVVPGTEVQTSAIIKNTGDNWASVSYLGYFLSSDQNLDSKDLLLGQSEVNSIPGKSTLNFTGSVMIPAGIVAGNYYLIYYADNSNLVNEKMENNNTAVVPFNVTASKTDLTVSTTYASASVPAGSAISLTYTVSNASSKAVQTSVTTYLSADPVLDNSDLFLGKETNISLSSNTSIILTASLTIPYNASGGNYYVLQKVDAENNVSESNENNNTSSKPVTVTATFTDITVSQFSLGELSNIYLPGNKVSLNSLITNSGLTPVNYLTVDFFLSSDPVLDASDLNIISGYAFNIDPGTSKNINDSYYLPVNQPAGDYYIIAKADPSNIVSESNENNNTAYQKITVLDALYDFTVPQSGVYYFPQEYNPGSVVPAYAVVKNVNTTTAYHLDVAFYLSTDNTLDNSDIFVSSAFLSNLSYNSEVTAYGDFWIPSNINAGTYYVIAKADYRNDYVETNEDNNTSYFTINIVRPIVDLSITGGGIIGDASSYTQGQYITLTSNIYNSGSNAAISVDVAYYLSQDNVLDNSDVRLIGTTAYNIAAGGTYYDREDFWLPENISSGNYYVIVKADSDNKLSETNENNNTYSYPLTIITPSFDYSIALISLNTYNNNIYLGYDAVAVARVDNIGNTASPATNVAFYLSSDNVLDSDDQLLSYGYLQALNVNQQSPAMTDIILENVAPGTYYLIAKVDPGNSYNEPDDSNNILYIPVHVMTGFPMYRESVDQSGTETTVQKVSLYPNPAQGEFNVMVDGTYYDNASTANIKVYNASGTLVKQHAEKMDAGLTRSYIDASALPAGIYSVVVEVNGNVTSHKLVIK